MECRVVLALLLVASASCLEPRQDTIASELAQCTGDEECDVDESGLLAVKRAKGLDTKSGVREVDTKSGVEAADWQGGTESAYFECGLSYTVGKRRCNRTCAEACVSDQSSGRPQNAFCCPVPSPAKCGVAFRRRNSCMRVCSVQCVRDSSSGRPPNAYCCP
mmetsp:Transcript_33231/g.105210  ORF Transcript_33231/g.105210 Transcript_33231/m.105210 type:complete len:162 (+) Transcript_33231:87-572(+)